MDWAWKVRDLRRLRHWQVAGVVAPFLEGRSMAEQKVGVVTHYWDKIGVAGLKITDGELRVGDTIHVKGHASDFTQLVESIHIGDASVEAARPGDDVGVKVGEHARKHDQVFKVVPD